jgi:hypothetical protein
MPKVHNEWVGFIDATGEIPVVELVQTRWNELHART